ncbi:MAG: vitamin K epoxide reductase family protein [Candidatus Nanohaloarchaea archaeon]|nr:vitamin K epoxide reductase family protein [Candidatus Nanohaloarchaea archaeon]
MERKTLLKAVIGLSIAGLAVAGYQTYEHYFLASSVCDLSSTFSCSIVTESRFGEFPPNSGIATAAWGVAWWLGLIALSTAGLKGREWVENQDFYLFSYIAAGLGFVAYLLAVELYILPQETGTLVICPFCTVQHVLILALLPLSYALLDKPVRAYLEDVFYREG